MNALGKVQMTGDVAVQHRPRHGHYVRHWMHGMLKLPAGTQLKYRARTLWLELTLRARLGLKGFARGLIGATGVFGVGRVYATLYRADGSVVHLGLLGTKLITDAAVAYIVDDWDGGSNTIDLFNYHGCGTGTTAEAAGDTALVTESTTALNPDSTRATGTKSQPSANILRSVGTATFDASAAITEHGLFSQAATGGGTLFDRTVFSAVNVVSGDSIQFTYSGTLSAGG